MLQWCFSPRKPTEESAHHEFGIEAIGFHTPDVRAIPQYSWDE